MQKVSAINSKRPAEKKWVDKKGVMKPMSKEELDPDIWTFESESHIMVDIETMGTNSDSVITSIGACQFQFAYRKDVEKQMMGIGEQPFEMHLDIADSLKQGGNITKSTLLWWMNQPDDARQALIDGQHESVSVLEGLTLFSDWIKSYGPNKQNVYLWGNGASFDPVLLEYWFKRLELDIPWDFRNVRCFRTLCALFPLETDKIPERGDKDVKHRALDDAMYQLRLILAMMAKYKMVLA
jgi:exodeoxyribonuclease VIII